MIFPGIAMNAKSYTGLGRILKLISYCRNAWVYDDMLHQGSLEMSRKMAENIYSQEKISFIRIFIQTSAIKKHCMYFR